MAGAQKGMEVENMQGREAENAETARLGEQWKKAAIHGGIEHRRSTEKNGGR